MRVYPIDDINIYNFKIKYSKYNLKNDISKIMLTDNGFFKNIKNELYLHKFNFKQKSQILKNYINNLNSLNSNLRPLKIE